MKQSESRGTSGLVWVAHTHPEHPGWENSTAPISHPDWADNPSAPEREGPAGSGGEAEGCKDLVQLTTKGHLTCP